MVITIPSIIKTVKTLEITTLIMVCYVTKL